MQKGLFDGMEMDYIDDPMEDYADYDAIYLGQQVNGDMFVGKPVMTDPFEFEFDDIETGKTAKKNKFRLCIILSESEEYLDIGINLNKKGNIQENVRKGSVLFDLLSGLMEQKESGSMQNFNVFTKVNLSSIKEFVNSLENMHIEVVEKSGKYVFNTIRIKGIE